MVFVALQLQTVSALVVDHWKAFWFPIPCPMTITLLMTLALVTLVHFVGVTRGILENTVSVRLAGLDIVPTVPHVFCFQMAKLQLQETTMSATAQ